MSENETIGQRLRRLREEQGLSQRDLAEPGISVQEIRHLLAVRNIPQVQLSLVSPEATQRTEGEEIFAAGAKIFWFR